MRKYTCRKCGNEDLIWRGYVAWDFRSQNFKVIEADDEAYCEKCDSEEEPITEDV